MLFLQFIDTYSPLGGGLLQVEGSTYTLVGGQPRHSLTTVSKHLPMISGICTSFLPIHEVISQELKSLVSC